MAAGPRAVAGPRHGANGGWARDMDRYAMQSEVEYLFRGLWRERKRGERGERERKREERKKFESRRERVKRGESWQPL